MTALAVLIFFIFSLVSAGLQITGGLQVPKGALFCTLTPLAEVCDRSTQGGIDVMYLVPFADIDSVTYGTDDEVTAITLAATKTWAKYEFEPDTAFFTQEKQLVGRNGLNYAQTLSVNFTGNSNAVRAALKSVDACCKLVAFVVDNDGKNRLFGILPKAGGSESKSTKLRSGAGAYNSGADSASEQNLRTFTLVANAKEEALYTSVLESSLQLT